MSSNSNINQIKLVLLSLSEYLKNLAEKADNKDMIKRGLENIIKHIKGLKEILN